MRILYLSQYFPPEAGATQTRAYEMASNWVRLGHSVTMLTEVPNHPSGIIQPEFKNKLYQRDQLDGINVLRLWVAASPSKNFRARMAFYLSYMLHAAWAGIFENGSFDLIYASSPPLFVGGAALAISYWRKIPLAFEVRDLWPESAVALGELKNQRAIRLATWLEEACYKRAQVIITAANGMRERLIERGQTSQKIHLVDNGANTELFQFNPDARNRLRQELNLGAKFTFAYTGIFGLAQGLEVVIEAAEILRQNPDLHFLLIGAGPKREELLHMAQERNLPNLTILPEKQREEIPGYLSAADAAVIPLKDLAIFRGVVPSKLFDAWACERPVILGVDGEARRLLEEADGGIYVPPENPKLLAEAAIKMASMSASTRLDMGKKARQMTVQRFSRRSQAEYLVNLLESSLLSSKT